MFVIAAVIVVLAAAAVVISLPFMFITPDDESKFIGTWQSDSISGVNWTITFNSNGSYTEEYVDIGYYNETGRGTWSISNNQLSFSINNYAGNSPTKFSHPWDYTFIESNHFSLSSKYLGLYAYEFVKSEAE